MGTEEQVKILSTATKSLAQIASKAAKELQHNHSQFDDRFDKVQKEIKQRGRRTDGFII